MPSFSKLFKNKDAGRKVSASNTTTSTNAKPQWVDAWSRTRIDPEEVADLLRGCTQELKSRALDVPFLLLPFRPASDPSAARSFVRNYLNPSNDRPKLAGDALINELRMIEVMVLISVTKWCWARLPGGIVSWETYNMFQIGEKDLKYARDSFKTFIPVSVDSDARLQIINDFFDLLAALAAHGKTNGLSGHKLSRYAGWWAFEHHDTGKGFEAGYTAWDNAANATSHLFFAYLRSQSPDPGRTNGILDLPRSLQQLVAATKYPPPSSLLLNEATKVVMVVDVVSPTPYALLRRAKNFEYRDDDQALQHFADYDDPVNALTDECKRVLRAISNTNQSNVSDAKTSTSLADPSWSRFEDIGFSSALDDIGEDEKTGLFSFSTIGTQGLSSTGRSPAIDLNRPTTPSWADFLSSGFADENGNKAPSSMLFPPDKMLPPIDAEPRGQSSQSHRRNLETKSALEPGELASITRVSVDDAFWWVWISSLAGEEPTSRKACFGRCALIETSIPGGRWMIMEEQVKGAVPEPVVGAYIAEKKSFLGFSTKRGKLSRRRSGLKKSPLSTNGLPKSELESPSTATLAPDQQARIQKAALELTKKKKAEETAKYTHNRRGRFDDPESKANSIFTLPPQIKDEASPAMQWAKQYDKNTIRAQYLGNSLAGKGPNERLTLPTNGLSTNRSTSTLSEPTKEKDLPTVPTEEVDHETGSASITPATTTIPPAPTAADPANEQQTLPEPKVEPVQAPAATEPSLLPVEHTAPTTNELSAEAAAVTLPPAASELEKVEQLPETKQSSIVTKPPSASVPPKVRPSSPQQTRKSSSQGDSNAAQRPSGIKRLFGTMRKSRDESDAPPPAPRANPAVAAARRALESKLNPPSSAPSQNNFVKYKGVRTPIAAATAVATVPQPAPKVDTETTAASDNKVSRPNPKAAPETKPASQPEPEPESRSFPEPVGDESQLGADSTDSEHQPPRTRRDEEFDNLSRVDTKEREQADKEFSRFDQGPLLEQPATLPDDFALQTETRKGEGDEGDEEEHFVDKHQSIYSAVTMPPDDTDEDEVEERAELTKEVTPNDRWAQIRRNAAERAARFSDDGGPRNHAESKPDDGDTSGEETIESRVARIKARVAELTGNMEGLRR